MDPQYGQQQQDPGNAPGYYPPPARQEQVATAGAPGQPDLLKRFLAAFIDFAVIGCAYAVVSIPLTLMLGTIGAMAAAVLGTAVVLARDVAFQGNSLGKKLFGLAAANDAGGPITLEQSAKRNITLAVGWIGRIFAPIPVLGLLAVAVCGLAALALGVYEIYNVATNQPRLGDKLAGTHVVAQGQAVIAF
jgi:uncharacterized RDD family membrane protein YckC